jgi:hypothetical protein
VAAFKIFSAKSIAGIVVEQAADWQRRNFKAAT